MKLAYLIECDGVYVKYKNMHHKFKKVENIGQAITSSYDQSICALAVPLDNLVKKARKLVNL